jgi:hypothetical protein
VQNKARHHSHIFKNKACVRRKQTSFNLIIGRLSNKSNDAELPLLTFGFVKKYAILNSY